MEYFIIFLFCTSCVLVFVEDLLPNHYKYTLFVVIGVCLLCLAGAKEIGIDPDSENYAAAYRTCYRTTETNYEYSFMMICRVLNIFTDDAMAIFLFYAFWGLLLKFTAFIRYNSNSFFLFVAIYLSFFFEVHEMMQIRTAILSGLFLHSVIEINNQRRILAFLYIVIGFFFHTSALILLPFLFFKTSPIETKERIFLTVFTILSLVFTFSTSGILDLFSNVPIIGDKITIYTKLADKGMSVNRVNGFGLFNLVSVATAIYLLYFAPVITREDNRFPLLLRIYVCGVAFYTLLSFIPELGARVSMLYKIVSIFIFADIIHTIKPKWASFIILELMLVFYLHYGLQFLGIDFLWATEL